MYVYRPHSSILGLLTVEEEDVLLLYELATKL